ncbi:MAG TPA: hypothetical protein VF456_12790 [Vicinamibacterales bacterium]
MRRRTQRLTIALGLALCVLAAFAAVWFPAGRAFTEDRNHDGRPDVWRSYNANGQLVSVALDTNFDGRSDVNEFYDNGALVRRELDRDFNNQIDLVQEFDPATRQIVRSISDVDADGVADLLLLFQNGQPVYSKWAHRHTAAASNAFDASESSPATDAGQPLLALSDPFSGDLAVKGTRTAASVHDTLALSGASGLPQALLAAVIPVAASSSVAFDCFAISAPAAGPRSPRGPPLLLLSLS